MTMEEIKKGESSHLEFKRETHEKKESFLKTVSAFSNTSGGKIIFGIDGTTLEVVGIDGDVFKLMDSVVNSISDNIEPLISPNINVELIENKTVIALEIFPTNHTPCFLKSKGKENGTFVRIGATSRIADFYSLRELELNGIRSSFDSQKCVNLMNDKNHFNSEVTQKLCAEIQKRMEKAGVQNSNVNAQTLESLGVLKKINGELAPTNAYALLTLSDFYDFSRCSIRCASFKGTHKAIFLDKLDCSVVFERKTGANDSVEEESSVKKFGVNEESSVKIVELMKENNSITAEDLSGVLKISKRAVEKQIQKLRESGKIKRIGADKNGYWKVCNGDEK